MSLLETELDVITDPVIEEIEKFMLACHNATKPRAEIRNNTKLDTDNLLNILINGSESDHMNHNKKEIANKRINSLVVNKEDRSNEIMLLRKRRHEKTDSTETKKIKTNKNRRTAAEYKVSKRSESKNSKRCNNQIHSKEEEDRSTKKENKSSRSKEKEKIPKIQRAKICSYKNERLCNLKYPKKRRAHALQANKLALVITTVCMNDSYIVKNHVIKREKRKYITEEFIDLTKEGTSMYVCLKFANIINIFQPEETCGAIPKLLRNAVIRTIPCRLNDFTVTKIFEHKVCFDLVPLVIDLIESDDDEFLVVISEKECVNEILPLVHKFYQLNEVNLMATEIIAQFPTIDEYFLRSRYNQADVTGKDLIKKIDNKYMKNFDISRLLNMVVIKFEQKYKIFIQPTTAALCLHIMLTANIKHCNNNQISQQILRESSKFIKAAKIKLENQNADLHTDCSGAFTQEQLNLLFHQIKLYGDICMRQQLLRAGTDFQDFAQLVPFTKYDCKDRGLFDKINDLSNHIPLVEEFTKQVKEELLNHY